MKLSVPQIADATVQVHALDDVIATLEARRPFLVVDVLRARQALGLGRPPALSRYARALRDLEDGDVAAAIAGMPEGDVNDLLYDACSFVTTAHAQRLADVLEQRRARVGKRLGALLARIDLRRCIRMIELMRDVAYEASFIEYVTEAYLTLVDEKAAIPQELAQAWTSVVDPDAPSSSSDGQRWTARLRAHARRDPVAALALLDAGIAELGASEIADGAAAVLARAVRVDRERAWAMMSLPRPCESRAYVLEGLVRDDPEAPEFANAFSALVEEWERGGWGVDKTVRGAFSTGLPLLAAAATAKREDLLARARDAFQPSLDQLRWATFAEMRRRFLRHDVWDPTECDRYSPPDYAPKGLASKMPIAPVTLSDAHVTAWWKLSTLPLPELPWHHPWEPALP